MYEKEERKESITQWWQLGSPHLSVHRHAPEFVIHRGAEVDPEVRRDTLLARLVVRGLLLVAVEELPDLISRKQARTRWIHRCTYNTKARVAWPWNYQR